MFRCPRHGPEPCVAEQTGTALTTRGAADKRAVLPNRQLETLYAAVVDGYVAGTKAKRRSGPPSIGVRRHGRGHRLGTLGPGRPGLGLTGNGGGARPGQPGAHPGSRASATGLGDVGPQTDWVAARQDEERQHEVHGNAGHGHVGDSLENRRTPRGRRLLAKRVRRSGSICPRSCGSRRRPARRRSPSLCGSGSTWSRCRSTGRRRSCRSRNASCWRTHATARGRNRPGSRRRSRPCRSPRRSRTPRRRAPPSQSSGRSRR